MALKQITRSRSTYSTTVHTNDTIMLSVAYVPSVMHVTSTTIASSPARIPIKYLDYVAKDVLYKTFEPVC